MRYFDLHCDTITECAAGGKQLAENDLAVSLQKAACFDEWRQLFAVWIPDGVRGPEALDYFNGVYAYFWGSLQKRGNHHVLPGKGRYFIYKRNIRDYALLSVEGGRAGGRDAESLHLREKGVRLLTLTWNGDNEIGSGYLKPENGLTDFGKALIPEMERRGVIVDVSHLSDRGFYEVAALARKPFVATHSNARAVCNHGRNLTDEQFCIIREMGGLVGINFYKAFLREGPGACMRDILRHIDHFLALGGENTVCMGSDFDGAEVPADLGDLAGIPRLRRLMRQHGYSDALAERLLFRNAAEFFRRNL
ncbi:MAG: dipeptidase [Oscillospiraceae bacterium]